MPSLAKIWQAGIGRIGSRRRWRELKKRIAALRGQRPSLLSALGQAAWSAGAVGEEYSGTAAELHKLDRGVGEEQAALAVASKALEESRRKQNEAERRYAADIEEGARPHRLALRNERRLASDLQRLERDRSRIENLIPMLRESEARLAEKINSSAEQQEAPASRARMRSDLKRRRRDAEEAEARLGEIEAKIAESQPKLGKVRRETAEYGERLAALKREAERELRALRVERGAAEAKLLACERNLSALNGAFEPLFYQLGEALRRAGQPARRAARLEFRAGRCGGRRERRGHRRPAMVLDPARRRRAGTGGSSYGYAIRGVVVAATAPAGCGG